MKLIYNVIAGLFLSAVLSSCSGGDGDVAKKTTTPEQKIQELTVLETQLHENISEMDIVLADSTVDAFVAFSKDYQDHPEAAAYLFKAAEIRVNQKGKALHGIVLFQDVVNKFPNHQLAPNALFMIAVTFDAILNDDNRALKGYREFLQKYPNHSFAPEARNLLAMIESSPDDLTKVKEWLKKADTSNHNK